MNSAAASMSRAPLAEGYPFGDHRVMAIGNLLEHARTTAGLSQAALAERAGTSRPTLSAYEHGRKSPTLVTAARIVGEAGFELTITPRIEFREVAADRGRPLRVPDVLRGSRSTARSRRSSCRCT